MVVSPTAENENVIVSRNDEAISTIASGETAHLRGAQAHVSAYGLAVT